MDVTYDLMLHWINYNVYTKARITVTKCLEEKLKKYKYLKDYPQIKKKETYWNQYNLFIAEYNNLFDIKGDADRTKRQEVLWNNVKMTERDETFYENMRLVPQVGYCKDVDRKWKKTETRKRKTEEQLEKVRVEAIQYKKSLQSTSTVDDEEDDGSRKDKDDDEYCPPPDPQV